MATSREFLRCSSVQSTASMWEKPYAYGQRTQKDAPFAQNEMVDSYEENHLFDNPDDSTDTDTESSPIMTRSSPVYHRNQQLNPWENPTLEEHLRIIVNDDENIDGISDAIRQEFYKRGLKWNDEEQEIRPWYFGLISIRLNFTQAKRIDLHKLSLPSRHPFWLKLKTQKQKLIRQDSKPKKPMRQTLSQDLDVALRYGALSDIDQFYYSPEHEWTNNKNGSTWTLSLDDQRNNGGHIEWIIEQPGKQIGKVKQILIINIDQCVIIDTNNEGFNIYICQKCNMYEFEANMNINGDNNGLQRKGSFPNTVQQAKDSSTKCEPQPPFRSPSRPRPPPQLSQERNYHSNSGSRSIASFKSKHSEELKTARISRWNYRRVGEVCDCYFPTIQFSVSTNAKNRNTQNPTIKNILSSVIEFFLAHNIAICYGKIEAHSGPEPYLFFQRSIPQFPSLIMKYSWQMLSVLGYRLQIKIDNEFCTTLFDLSKTLDNPDELFYRVCVYLSRIFSIKPFADINQELQHAIRESKRKREESDYDLVSKLDTADPNEAYISSVTITPTTIRIKPLKLCRTNRVLRENQQFGKALEHFVLVDIRDENGRDLQSFHFRDLREHLLDYLVNGFSLMDDDRQYKYLHHSQSQLRERQFWFYHHENNGSNLSFTDAYRWMGTFDKEKNPAKHASCIALCFSTTRAAVQVPVKRVLQIDDIKTIDSRYTFTDGCGTMSEKLRDTIKEKLGIRRDFSAVQFRYDGAKGVVSLHLNMSQDIDLLIRDSMKKFESQHDTFEVCKLSAPRPLYLNRQAILLLSYRQIPETSFLILQQRNHLQLVRALLRNTDAEKLILHKVPSWFLPRDIHRANLDYIHEPFFRQLLISACVQSTRELLQRTRIRIPPNEGRNMMGIVDEYGVLEPNEVYIQYTTLTDEDADDDYSNEGQRTKVLEKCQVVITKNPCHHPGDIRTFTAVNRDQLSHLQDVIVFSQKGSRPAPHDISGSDLDGDEYSVIWHKDLVPSKTENADPYDYDANIPSKRYDKPVERDVINKTVLEIAENDYLGRLSNLHLAFADKFGVDDRTRRGEGVLSTIELAGAISLEVDSGKTGYHPLNDEKIKQLNSVLENKRPDYMDNPNFEQYPSEHVLGKLYRSSKRTIRGWNRLIRYHRHLRHLEVRTNHDSDEEDDKATNENVPTNIDVDDTLMRDVDREHPAYQECAEFADPLTYVYRQEMLEILNLYGLSHESDLWCRNSVNGLTGELEDTAYTELEQLVVRTRRRFYYKQIEKCETGNCHEDTTFPALCTTCKKRQRSMAVACYCACYGGENIAEQTPILSLPWLFASPLLQSRLGEKEGAVSHNLLGIAMKKALNDLIYKKHHLVLDGPELRFRRESSVVTDQKTVDIVVCAFFEVVQEYMRPKRRLQWSHVLNQFIQSLGLFSPTSNQHNLTYNWKLSLDLHEIDRDDIYADILSSLEWSETEDALMHKYFQNILEICFENGQKNDDIHFLSISEDIILLLQKMAINETIFSEDS